MSVELQGAGLLRRLALSDEVAIGSIFNGKITDFENAELGDKVRACVRLAALIASDAAAPSYQWVVTRALAAGVSKDEMVGVLMSVARIVGADAGRHRPRPSSRPRLATSSTLEDWS